MTVRAFEASPEFEVHNENDRRAFDRFQLRSDRVIRSLIEHSGHRYVLFKPLCDSHRIVHLLDHLGAGSPGRAFWVYRSVDGRVRSSLAKFGDNNLQVLREIAQGRGEGMWQAQRMSADTLALIHDLDLDSTSAETAAALFWYARNSLYFEMGLDRRNDVMLVSYDSFVRRADEHLQAMCAFLGCEFRPETAAAIAPRGASLALPLAIDPAIRLLCDGLDQRLSAAAASALRRFDASAEADGVAAAG